MDTLWTTTDAAESRQAMQWVSNAQPSSVWMKDSSTTAPKRQARATSAIATSARRRTGEGDSIDYLKLADQPAEIKLENQEGQAIESLPTA